MIDDADLDVLLASLEPRTDSTPLSPDRSLAHIARRVRARRARRRTLLAGPAVLVAAAGATAAGFALSPQPSAPAETINVACAAQVDGSIITGVLADGRDPAAQCAELWQAGEMVAGRTAVPPLQACVAAGRVTVYPSIDACGILAEPPFAGYSVNQQAAIALNTAIRGYQDRTRCIQGDDAKAYVEQQLQDRGLAGWSVTAPADGQCLGFRLDLSTKTVTFAP